MFYSNFPKFLDKILLEFSNNYNSPKSLDELTKKIFKKEITKGYDLNNVAKNFDKHFKEITYSEYLINALDFLNQEGLVYIDRAITDKNQKSIYITSKGFFKIKTEGFSKKITNDKLNLNLQRAVWISMLLTLGITIYTQFIKPKNFYNTNTSKISTDCNRNILTCPSHNTYQLNREKQGH